MSQTVRILPRAERDTDCIYVYLAKRSPAGAVRWWEAFEHAIGWLRAHASQCPLAPESTESEHELRQFLFKTRRGRTYRGVFTIAGDEVRVLRVRGPGEPPLEAGEMPSA